jgi:DNA-binding Lrp family transcriptional regulator
MDEVDMRLLAELKRDARASLAELSAQIGVGRATVRMRLARLVEEGEIVGFTTVTRRDVATAPVRGLMMLGIEGRGSERIRTALTRMPQVQAVHSTNGNWDLIAEISTDTLEKLDQTLFAVRRLEGVQTSETNLLLSTRRAGRA